MEEVRRWSVTFTKHMKQKRKVYQDGFLALYSASRKVKLYDESENVLEIRMLKSDEVVKAGETLTFHSHIVDVGDCEGGDDNPFGKVNFENKVRKFARFGGVRPGKKFRSPISDSCKIKVDREKSSADNSSPTQKLIREFKKAELQKYMDTKSYPVKNESSVTEWVALYSTQTLKKAKIYHDGYVSLVSSGLQGRKVILYDSRRNLLSSRFLKNDELVKSGESLSFDGHIVDIGELEVDKPGDDNVVKEINSKCIKELINSHRLKKTPGPNPSEVPHNDGSSADLSDITNSYVSNSEWLVLYTTKLTQKAKKFHDGFLSLTHHRSLRKVMLFDISRQLLDSRFLKRDEDISPNELLSFGGHLVDVGEPIKKNMFDIKSVTQKTEAAVPCETRTVSGRRDFVKASETLVRYKNVPSLTTTSPDGINGTKKITVEEASPRYSWTGNDTASIAGSSSTDDNRPSNTVPTNKPLRDVSGIISSLQRPCSNDKFTPVGPTSAVDHLLKHSHFQSPIKTWPVLDTQTGQKGGPCQEFSNRTGTVKSGVRDNLFACTELESLYELGDSASGCAHDSNTRLQQTSMDGCQINDSAANLGAMNERELKTTSFPHSVSSANEETLLTKPVADICSKGNLATLSLTEILNRNSSHILEHNEAEKSKKDMVAVDSLPSSKPLESSLSSNPSAVTKTMDDMDEWPSFDLGFE